MPGQVSIAGENEEEGGPEDGGDNEEGTVAAQLADGDAKGSEEEEAGVSAGEDTTQVDVEAPLSPI